MLSSFYFFGGVADLFISIVLWFIFDETKTPSVLFDGRRVYTVIDVVRLSDSGINTEDLEDDHVAQGESMVFSHNSMTVAEKMIEQFFELEYTEGENEKYDTLSDYDSERETLIIDDWAADSLYF